ncbi:MAG TPA: PleD family two-component system response regulator [Thiohalobacter sp.]|nr:PleD family two-component system response regulator [Thiohalobacter sp.]
MKESALMEQPASETDTDQPCVVLLVDDQEMVAEGIRRMVADEPGIELHYCQDPRNAIQMATELKVTTILQDLVMPEIDGIMLVRFYRANPVTQDIPVIVLSSKEDPTVKSDAFGCGANDYLVKLPDKIELIARVRAHSRSYLLQRERDAAYHALREIQRQLEESNSQLEESNRELQRLSSLDGLTGIANRRQFDKQLEKEWQLALHNGTSLALVMIDIDYFKLYNDTHGHQLGDDCLKAVARELARVVHRPSDLVARYGGEEFGLILPDTDREGALQVAEKMQQVIHALNIEHEASKVSDRITLSIGVATASPCGGQPCDLLKQADAALYEAKSRGRNRIVVKSGTPIAG